MKKLLLFDVDGTLIDYDGTLPESTKRAISKAREKDRKSTRLNSSHSV